MSGAGDREACRRLAALLSGRPMGAVQVWNAVIEGDDCGWTAWAPGKTWHDRTLPALRRRLRRLCEQRAARLAAAVRRDEGGESNG